MKMYRTLLLIGIIIWITFLSCSKDPVISNNSPNSNNQVIFQVPEGWPQPVYQFQNNPLTQSGFELGRKLFYDPRLSRDNTISCGSCHQSFSAFAHLGHTLSHGVENRLGTRNTPPLFNLNWHPYFFWDGGSNHIEIQPIAPIQNPVEMDETLENIISKLKSDADYRKQFAITFGDETINSQRMLRALAQFLGAMVSTNSKYDQYIRNKQLVTFTLEEERGLQLYRTHCATCHKEPLFTDFSFRSNGLPIVHNDSGRARITLKQEDFYKFKVPSLRNLKYTPPYMHDGRFASLDEVLDHYTSGINPMSPNLDPILTNGISLSAQDRTDLIAFLNTLNDESFIQDKRFHNQ